MTMIYRKDKSEPFKTDSGAVLITHEEDDECREFGCVIHNPSDNFMNRQGWAYNWRGGYRGMERIDPIVGGGHPDPDSQAWAKRHGLSDPGLGHGCMVRKGYAICNPRAWE